MNFFNEMRNTALNKIEYNMSVTENGALGFKTSGKYLLDMNFKVASMRNMTFGQIKNMFSLAYAEDPRLAIIWLFYVRDVREGLGERRLFRCILPEVIKDIKDMDEPKKRGNEKNITDLVVMFNNVSEQIKIYENSIADAKEFE